MPVPPPDKLRLYRITHHDNVATLLRQGMHARNHPDYPADYVGIGNPTLTRDRTTRKVPGGPGGTLNDYVPFYLGPRSPMLYCIWKGSDNVPQRPQRDIVYVVSRFDRVRQLGLPFAFTNGHAYQLVSRFYFEEAELDRVDWPAVAAHDWGRNTGDPDLKRRKQAEFLIHHHVPVAAIVGLGVYDEWRQAEMESMVQAVGLSLPVVVVPRWYY